LSTDRKSRAGDLVLPAGDVLHHLGGTAHRGHGQAAAERLGEADDVRLHARQRGHPARPGGEAGLHLVEGEQRAVRVQQVPQPGEVTGSGMMIPAFIMIGSRIIPAIWPGCSSSSVATLSRSLNVATRVSRVIAPAT
jgi:hypothetical protein